MKKTLIALAVIAASGQALAIATADKLSGIPHKPKQPNDGQSTETLLKPIVTREMLAGTQKMLDTSYTKKHANAKPLPGRKPYFIGEQPESQVLADRKPRDVRPIHIGGGCSDIGGITKLNPAQLGQQHRTGAHAAALA